MNNKGLTLVELLTVIAILALIALLGVGAYNAVRISVLNRQYDSLVLSLKSAANTFSKERRADKVYVQTLVDHGLVPSEKGFVTSPKDGEVLNCYYFDFSSEDVEFKKDPDCNIDSSYDIKLYICTSSSCTSKVSLNETKWYKSHNSKIYLTASNRNDNNFDSYEWINGYDYDNPGTESIFTANVSSGTNEIYLKVNNKFQKKIYLKVDDTPPSLSKSIINNISWYTVTIHMEDSQSGLKGYYYTPQNGTPGTFYTLTGKTSYDYLTLIMSPGGIFAVQDESGNIEYIAVP